MKQAHSELTQITADLDMATGSLSAAAGRIAHLEEEEAELLEVRAHLEAIQKWILEEIAVMSRIEGELAEFETQ